MKSIIFCLCAAVSSFTLAMESKPTTSPSFADLVTQINTIYQNIGVGKVVEQVNTSMTEVIKETIVEKEEVAEMGSSMVGFLFLGSFATPLFEEVNSTSKRDRTKMLAINPQEVVGFETRVKNELQTLRKKLDEYVFAHMTEIREMQDLASQAFAIYWNEQVAPEIDQNTLNQLFAQVANINFLGQQTVSFCTRTEYANRDSYEESQTNWVTPFLTNFFGNPAFNYKAASYERTWKQYAHSVTSCDPTTSNSLTVSLDDPTYELQIAQNKTRTLKWYRAASVRSVQNTPPLLDPHYGNPYFRDFCEDPSLNSTVRSMHCE